MRTTNEKLKKKIQEKINDKGFDDICLQYSRGFVKTKKYGKVKYEIFNRALKGTVFVYYEYGTDIFDMTKSKLKKEITQRLRKEQAKKAAQINIQKNGIGYAIGNLHNYRIENGHPLKGKKRKDEVWNKGMTKETDERLRLSSERMMDNNPIHRMTHNEKEQWKNKISKSHSLKIMKGEYFPPINCWNNSIVEWRGKKYRSSWEVLFHYLNPYCEYEHLKISYFDTIKKKNRIFIVDFIDKNRNNVYEIKPKERTTDINFGDKMNALLLWGKNNNYLVHTITQDYFKDKIGYLDMLYFNENIRRKIGWIK